MSARTYGQTTPASASPATAPQVVLQRKCACGGTPGPTGECAACRRKRQIGRDASAVEAKLSVNQPGDRYEMEADRVADRVMRMDETLGQRQVEAEQGAFQARPIGPRITPLVQRQADPQEEDEEEVQAKRLPGGAAPVTPQAQERIDTLRGGGEPLPETARAFFEPRLGLDFGKTRIHTGATAAEAARSLNARAFTLGRDIFFGPGEFQPETSPGRRLLAHELVHTIQQGAAPSAKLGSTSSQPASQIQRVPAGPSSISESPGSTRRLRRWAKRVTVKAVDRWIKRLRRGQAIAFPRLRLKRARRVVQLAGGKGHQNTPDPIGLDEAALDKLTTLEALLSKRLEGSLEQDTRAVAEPEPEAEQAESPPPDFRLKGVPSATLQPQLSVVTGVDLLAMGPRFMDMDFALQAHFEASGEVEASGSSDEEAAKWEVGFLQTVISSKDTARYRAGTGRCFGLQREVPPNTRDGEIDGTPPWYSDSSKARFERTDSAVKVSMDDHPPMGLKWSITEKDAISGAVEGWGPLDVTCGGPQFGTWLVTRHRGGGRPFFLYFWQWSVDFSGDFLAKKEKIRSLATQVKPEGMAGMGSLEPKLDGRVANQSTIFNPIPREKCRPCDQM